VLTFAVLGIPGYIVRVTIVLLVMAAEASRTTDALGKLAIMFIVREPVPIMVVLTTHIRPL